MPGKEVLLAALLVSILQSSLCFENYTKTSNVSHNEDKWTNVSKIPVASQKKTFLLPQILSDSKLIDESLIRSSEINIEQLGKFLFNLRDVLSDLASTALMDTQILFIIDERLHKKTIADIFDPEIFKGLQAFTIYSSDVWDPALEELLQNNLLPIIIYEETPVSILDHLMPMLGWKSEHLFLFGLNVTYAQSGKFLTHEVIHRSKFITSFEKNGDKEFVKVYKVLPFVKNADISLKRKNVGPYRQNMFPSLSSLSPDGDYNLNNVVLEIASWCDDAPFIYENPSNPEKCEGLAVDILEIISKKLQFSYAIQLAPPDFNWGSKENGTWDGMLLQLINGEKHLAINTFVLTEDRNSDFDTTYPYYTEKFSFAIKLPDPPPQWIGLIYPFTGTVWITFIAVSIIVAVCLTVALKYVPDSQDYRSAFLLVSLVINIYIYIVFQ